MTAQQIVAYLLEAPTQVGSSVWLEEASVHLPRRGTSWVATYRDETGEKVWKSTGLTDHEQALALAKHWEEEARQRRRSAGAMTKKPTIRVRAGSAERTVGLLSQREVGLILRISERAVRQAERTAFDKIRNHPLMKSFWAEWQGGEIEEADHGFEWRLSQSEMIAVLALAQTPEEHQVLRKVIALVAKF